jgi:CheY-like chemotaxis protein
MGHRVDIAHGVYAALDLSSNKQVDLLISDIGLPDGSGIDLITELRRKQPIMGIAVPGYGMEEDVARSREAGFTQHWTKPNNVEQLKSLANLGK